MATTRKKTQLKPIHSRIGVKVEDYAASVEARINFDAKDPRYALEFDDRDPVHKYVTRLTIVGTATYSEDRVGHRFEVTVYGDESPSRHVFTTIKDLQKRGKYGEPLFRQYRGRTLPVLAPPPGLGLLDKVRGEPLWTAWANVAARTVSDMLILLGTKRELFLAIDERKVDRARWVDGLSLQSTDPAEE